MKKIYTILMVALLLFPQSLLLPTLVLAHRGRVSLLGCHDNKKKKTHECHRGQLRGQVFSSQMKMLETLEGRKMKRFIPGSAAVFSGKVVEVLEADTLELLVSGVFVKIRLANIDAPEVTQPFGWQAKRFTSNQVSGKVVTIRVTDHDRYGRMRGNVLLTNGRSLNRELLRAGLAWWIFSYSSDAALEGLEKKAKLKKRGLWEDEHPLAPWIFLKRR